MNYSQIKEQNLGYAGFLFKKAVQPNPLRSKEVKTPIDFLETNLFLYLNKKVKELKKNTGRNDIPHEFFQDVTISMSIQKKFSRQQILQNSTQVKRKESLNHNSPSKKAIQAKNKKKVVTNKNKGAQQIMGLNSPEKKVRNVLYEKISDKSFEKCFKQFKRSLLMQDYEKIVATDQSLMEDSLRRTEAFKELVLNYQSLDDKERFIEEVCRNNNITLSSLLEIDEEKIHELLRKPQKRSSVMLRQSLAEEKKNAWKKLEKKPKEEEDELHNFTPPVIPLKSDKFMRKTQNYMLKSDFKVKTLRKLSTPKYITNVSDYSNTSGTPFNLHRTHYSPQRESISMKTNSTPRLNKEELMKKFKNFFEKCDNEEYHEKHQTENAKDKIGTFRKEIKDLRKMVDSKKKDLENNNEEGAHEGRFQQFKAQTKFKKKIIDILLGPIQNKQDLYFIYNKNQMLKDHIQKQILKEK